MTVYLFSLILFVLNLPSQCICQLSIEVNYDGSYEVLVDNEAWLISGDTFFRADKLKYSAIDGSLKLLIKPVATFGEDVLGSWKGFLTNYSANGKVVSTDVRCYSAIDRPTIVFTQTFVDGLESTSTSNANKVVSAYPSFITGTNSSAELGYFPFNGIFAGWERSEDSASRWTKNIHHLKDGVYSGPLVLFDKFGTILVVSSFSQFMAASYEHDVTTSTISWGIMGMVDKIPPGFSYSTVIVYGSKGFNRGIMDWGSVLRQWYSKDAESSRQSDISVNYLGYYTDNGGYYYQVPEAGLNMEETLLNVYSYAGQNVLPYRYIQYDDWFYPTTGPTSYQATVTWDAKPSIFPHGLQYLYNKTNLPVVAHNRYWSDKTPYAKQNGGKYNFVFDGEGNALPDDQVFWDDLFGKAKMWGLVTYEQDWLSYQFESMKPVQEDLTLATRWLHQMASSADKYGLTLQYCMSFPRHVLATVEMKAVTHVRASTDYFWRYQYKIGFTSLLLHSLGLAPFKDNFWTMRDQPGNKYNMTESNPHMQAIVALLSTGPVGVSDRIGYTDVDLVKSDPKYEVTESKIHCEKNPEWQYTMTDMMRCGKEWMTKLATKSGLLLQPSKPATAIDAQVLQIAFGGNHGPKGELWTSESVIGHHLFGIIFALELSEPYELTIHQTGWLPLFQSSYVYTSKYFTSPWQPPAVFDDYKPLLVSGCSDYNTMCLYYTSPVFTLSYPDRTRRLYLAGEMDKAVPMSPKRIRSISTTPFDVRVELEGTTDEVINFDVCDVITNGTVSCQTVQCTVTAMGKAVLSTRFSTCQ